MNLPVLKFNKKIDNSNCIRLRIIKTKKKLQYFVQIILEE